jgi:CRISPR-associated protein Cmr1
LAFRQGNTALNTDPIRTAIDNRAAARLSLALPDSCKTEVTQSIQFSNWFGTLGSRSRNGWGALQLAGNELLTVDQLSALDLQPFTRSLADCLELDWAHAIGLDRQGPLVWKTRRVNTWSDVMRELARIKIAFRTQLNFTHPGFNARHMLAYPVTHHSVLGNGWGGQGRLANQIRFKVVHINDAWQGIIVHLPCSIPAHMAAALPRNYRSLEIPTWQAVHAVLDQSATRIQ